MATSYNLCLLSKTTHASNCSAGICEFEEFKPHRQLVSVGYDMVKHAKYRC